MATVFELPGISALQAFVHAAVEVLLEDEGFEPSNFELSEWLGSPNPDDELEPIFARFEPTDEPYLRRQIYRATVRSLSDEAPMLLGRDPSAPLPIVSAQRLGMLYEGELPPERQFLSCTAPLLSRDGRRGTLEIQRGHVGGAEDYRVTLRRVGECWERVP